MMEPGRELDALVAEMMGWHVVTSPNSAPLILRLQDGGFYRTKDGEPADMVGGVPAYSTDIAAAWEVVEKLRADGKPLYLIPYLTGWMVGHDSGEGYLDHQDTAFGGTVDSHLFDSVTAATVQHAICLSALKTVA